MGLIEHADSPTRLAVAVLVLWLAPAQAEEIGQPESTHAVVDVHAARAQKWLLAAAHPLAAAAGRDVLARGGSAVDAAVAVQLMLNLVEPQSSGIGGGAFALHWEQSAQRLSAWDGRETAPAAAGEDYWLDDDGAPLPWWDAVVGGRSVGVPGTLLLLETLHRRHGRLPWATLFTAAIQQAESGFVISPRLAASIEQAAEKQLALFDDTRAYFFNPDGSPKPAGTVLRNPQFARTLRRLAEHGSRPFYHGAIARELVAATRTAINPGLLTPDDLAGYTVKQRTPVCIDYRGNAVCGIGPPSSGGLTVGQILGLLAGFDLPSMPRQTQAWHLFAEAAKLAYADRAQYMADSDYVAVPDGLLNRDYLSARAQLIAPTAAMPKASAGSPPGAPARFPDGQEERPGTSHFVIVDGWGDLISMTTTIETGFGSRVMTNGFLLNNELTDFAFLPQQDGLPVANRVAGGKRPRSSMAPTIVLRDGRPFLLLGSPGGSRIINYVAATLVAILDWNMDVADAVALGHVVNRNGATDLETATDAAALAAPLRALGHTVNIRDLNSGLHVIRIAVDGTLSGAADPRREGVVLGQ